MRAIHDEYVRACICRKRNAMISVACASLGTLLVGLNPIHSILVGVVTWLVAWEIGTHRVKVIKRIYLPGEHE